MSRRAFDHRIFRPSPARDRAIASSLAWPIVALSCVLALSGCGTFSGRSSDRPADATQPGKRGGYYLDDGPGERPPANLDQIADAVPRAEPLHRGASRPYAVMGRSYTPMTQLRAYRSRGMATWYGRRYHGKRTASGEIYDMYAMTGAHTVLPIPSYARVTNLANGRSVVVRINDRGPFLGERLIDLSYVAAHKLDIVGNGSGLVEVEAILPDAELAPPTGLSVEAAAAAVARDEVAAAAIPPQSAAFSGPSAGVQVAAYYLQLAAFAVRDNAERFIERLRPQLSAVDTSLAIVESGNLHRIHAGPYASRAAALQAAELIGQSLGAAPVLIAPR